MFFCEENCTNTSPTLFRTQHDLMKVESFSCLTGYTVSTITIAWS